MTALAPSSSGSPSYAPYPAAIQNLPLTIPSVGAGREPVWHRFVVLHPERDRIRAELEAAAIQTGLHYPTRLHLQPAYRDLGYGAGDFPVAECVGRKCNSLPLYPEMTEAQQDAVIAALTEAVAG